MASLNKVFLLGNLTRNPELRYTPGGAAVCEFGLATNRKFIQNNEQKEEVCFIDIVVWGKLGESCQRYLVKGSQALIEGRLQYDQWDDRETGKRRSTLRVIAERVQFMGSRQDSQQNNKGGCQQQQSNQYHQPQQQSYQGAHYHAQQPQQQQGNHNYTANDRPANNGFPDMPNDAFNVNSDIEDDIPF